MEEESGGGGVRQVSVKVVINASCRLQFGQTRLITTHTWGGGGGQIGQKKNLNKFLYLGIYIKI